MSSQLDNPLARVREVDEEIRRTSATDPWYFDGSVTGESAASHTTLKSLADSCCNALCPAASLKTAWSPATAPVRVPYGGSTDVQVTDQNGKTWKVVLHPERLRAPRIEPPKISGETMRPAR
jgi:hypothetical protein